MTGFRVHWTLRQLLAGVAAVAVFLGVAQFLAWISKPEHEGHPHSEVRQVAYSPDGKTLAGFLMNGWEGSFSDSRSLDCSYSIMILDSTKLSRMGLIDVFQQQGPEPIAFTRGPTSLQHFFTWQKHLSIGIDGESVLAVRPDSWQLEAWNIALGRLSGDAPIHRGVVAFSASPKGESLAILDLQQNVTVWEMQTGRQLISRVDWGLPVFARDGKRLAVNTSKGVEVWDIATNMLLATFAATEKMATSSQSGMPQSPEPREEHLSLSHDGQVVATVTEQGLRVSSVNSEKQILIPAAKFDVKFSHSGERVNFDVRYTIRGIAFSPDSKYLAAWGQFGVRLFDVSNSYALFGRRTKNTIFCLAFSPDGKTYATGGDRGDLAIWDTGTGEELRSIRLSL